MDTSMLTSLQLSTSAWSLILIGVVLLGALLLIGVVRITEGFSISMWTATKITFVSLFAVVALQVLVTLALMLIKMSPSTLLWTSSLISLFGSLVIYMWIYGLWVKSPTGEAIGIGRAMKVTLVQSGLTIVLLIAIVVVFAVLVSQGVVKMPELPR